ncbi:Phosphoinositide phospholipase C 2 [Acorus calamus]|uniref:Phosphoinositide phospholipase C n=1 Tax=Acorus calamus TaxID=4465 RepID=A0AAV9F592_ACOCL|nr:Phosphoinositide phospholipase C 2 [Acorus calamus]
MDRRAHEVLRRLRTLSREEWARIARDYVNTKNTTQITSHAQKHFLHQSKNAGKQRKGSSIFDLHPPLRPQRYGWFKGMKVIIDRGLQSLKYKMDVSIRDILLLLMAMSLNSIERQFRRRRRRDVEVHQGVVLFLEEVPADEGAVREVLVEWAGGSLGLDGFFRYLFVEAKPPISPSVGGSGSINAKEDDEEARGKEVPLIKSHFDNEDKNSEHIHDVEDQDDGDPTSNQSTAPEYKRLITMHVDPHKVRRLSLSGQELVEASESHSMELLRVYPKGTPVTSSNFSPLNGWIHGAQMISLNMQGFGRSSWLMHGKFRANGGCDFVKKPDLQLKEDENGNVFDLKAKLPVKKTFKGNFSNYFQSQSVHS